MTPVEAEYRALLSPRVAGELAPPPSIAIGRGELRLAPGTRIYQLTALARPCGLLVDGPATFTYRVEDPHSRPLALRNVDGLRALKVAEANGATLTAALDHAAIWSWELAVAHGEPRGGARPLPSWLADHLERQIGPNPARDMQLSSWNKDAGYAWAYLESGGERFNLDVDPRPQAKTESLSRFEQVDIAARPYGGRRYPQELVTQPIGRAWTDLVAFPYVVTANDLTLTNDRGMHVSTVARVRVVAQDDLRLLPFALWSDLSDDTGSLQPYRIARLTVDGARADFVHHEDSLLVHLPQAATKGRALELEVEVEGQILDRPEGDNYWVLSYAPWYPLAHEGLTRASFHVTMSTPAPYVPFSSGAIVRREVAGGLNVVETSLTGPAEAAVVLAGKYNVISESRDGYTLNIATYLTKREKEAKKLADLFYSFKSCYEYWLGTPYPFPELHVLEINDWGWGQAPPGVIFITKEAFMTRARAGGEDSEEIAEATTRGINERFAHEIAHGYFPHTAMIASQEDSWLSESFADYVSAVCVQRSAADKSEGERRFNRQLREWKSFSGDVKEGVSVHLAEHLSGRTERDGLDRHRVLYGRGPLVLHALREELAKQSGAETGEKQFFAFVRAYVMSFRGKTTRTADLVAILDQITGKSWQPWFEKYVYGFEVPKVKV
jgi:hypothetical protein